MLLGVDIGGTKIATGLVDREAQVSSVRSVPTLANEGYQASIQQVWRAIEEGLSSGVEAIGICAPGPLNPKTGVVLNPPNLPGWSNVALREMAQARFGLRVRVENDCNAAGLAEARFGAAKGCSSVFYAAIGTGIGSGIILDGKIYHGKNGAAAEGGHVSIDYRSETICRCGSVGCIEALASGHVLERMGDYDLNHLAIQLGAWLGSVVSLLDPDIIVIGGGVAKIGEPLFERLREIVPKRTVNPHAGQLPIVAAKFGAEAGIVGAAAVMMGRSSQQPGARSQ
ncbi:MAG TPA: ROK family protein [Bryobacteraceae bacterium]|jgi:glucokinase|nr:ROK family protein [Bryobacteraceae bacterium]